MGKICFRAGNFADQTELKIAQENTAPRRAAPVCPPGWPNEKPCAKKSKPAWPNSPPPDANIIIR